MNKKNFLKLILDICMIIVLVLMYNKQSINMTFHELGGLILLGVFLIHIIINYKWVIVVTKKLFSKSLPFKTKLGYILNILLLIDFALIGISGILISKVLFKLNINSSIPWKSIHYSTAAFALILIGIHVGLHRQFIWGIIQKIFHMPKMVSMVVGILLTLVIFPYGCYNVYSTSFTRWLVMPFSSQQSGFDKGNGEMRGDFNGSDRSQMPGGEDGTPSENGRPGGSSDISGAPDNFGPNQGTSDNSTSSASNSDTSSDSSAATDSNAATDSSTTQDSSTTDNSASAQSSPSITGAAPNTGNGDFNQPSGDFKGNIPGNKGQSGGITTALSTIIEFFSITYVFATITALIELAAKKAKNKKAQPDTTE